MADNVFDMKVALEEAVNDNIMKTQFDAVPAKIFHEKNNELVDGKILFFNYEAIFSTLESQRIFFLSEKNLLGITLHKSTLPGDPPPASFNGNSFANHTEEGKLFPLSEDTDIVPTCVHLKVRGESRSSIKEYQIEVDKSNIDFVFSKLLGLLNITTLSPSPGSPLLPRQPNRERSLSKSSLEVGPITTRPRLLSQHSAGQLQRAPSPVDLSPSSFQKKNNKSPLPKKDKAKTKDFTFEVAESELLSKSELIDKDFVQWVRSSLPGKLFDRDWKLLYTTSTCGFSLTSLYRFCKDAGPTVIVCKDDKGWVFGCFCSEEFNRKNEFYYGSGECFLFRAAPTRAVFLWSEKNEFIMHSTDKSISMGGGGGKSGFWLDSELYHGQSYRCNTFDNEPLANKEDFTCVKVEVWGFQAPKYL